ncbi:MAG: VanW family protein [Anaerolineae bacterium]|nr:VanW family protein [Anaerolineae bacterium]MDW8068921.1 VanW family protein [Anaerolineae bacterium]
MTTSGSPLRRLDEKALAPGGLEWLVLLLTAALAFLGALGLILAYEAWCADRIYPGVWVGNVPVGGLRLDEATHRLRERLVLPPVRLVGPERAWDAPATDMGLHLQAEATARAAFQVGRGPEDGPMTHLLILFTGYSVSPILSYDESAARLYLQALAKGIDIPPEDATLTLQGLTPVSTPARPGRMLDVEGALLALRQSLQNPSGARVELVVREVLPQIASAEAARARAEALLSEPFTLLLPNPRQGDPGPWPLRPEELARMLTTTVQGGHLAVTLDREALRAFLESIAPSLAIEPVDARFHLDRQTGQLVPIAPSSPGRALDVEASIANILAAVAAGQHTAPLTVRTVPPQFPETATAEELGIRELVAEGDSYFIGSPSGRDHNIRLAASKFDGLVIAPGETFSFNRYLGEVSREAGYDEAYVTLGEQLAIEVGGGICQVSTTAFRAALRGGYPILERWAHHHRVGYYELRGHGPGLDATVYAPLLDFKFVNDRPTALLIETEIEETNHRLIFRFYSTDDGRRVEIKGPIITDETEPGPPIYQLDEKLPPGTVVEWQTAQKGLTARVERWVYDAGGNLLYHNVFVSKYAPRRAAYRYGPGYEPPSP